MKTAVLVCSGLLYSVHFYMGYCCEELRAGHNTLPGWALYQGNAPSPPKNSSFLQLNLVCEMREEAVKSGYEAKKVQRRKLYSTDVRE